MLVLIRGMEILGELLSEFVRNIDSQRLWPGSDRLVAMGNELNRIGSCVFFEEILRLVIAQAAQVPMTFVPCITRFVGEVYFTRQ